MGKANGTRRLEDDALALELIRARQARGSFMIVKASLVLLLTIALPFSLYVLFAINRELGPALLGIVGFATAFEIALWFLYQRGHYRAWLDWITATLEISLVTLVVIMDARKENVAYAFSSAPPYLYFIAILVNAVRLRRALSLYSAFLAAAAYMGVYAVLGGDMDPAAVALVPSLEAWNIFQRAVYLVFAGFVAYLVCAGMRTSVAELIASVRQRLQMERTLGRHVSPEVARVLVDSESASVADERELTVLFADLRGFTGFSERRDPSTVFAFLNDYFAVAASSVERYGGIVNKFTGDGLLALFGAPIAGEDHALRASCAGIDMVGRLTELRAKWDDEQIRIGVGIHTGRAVVGTVGAEQRAEYTAVGDAVNVAARIEELTKSFDHDILISDATAAALGDRADVERVDTVQVRGRSQPVTLYRLTDVRHPRDTPVPASPLLHVDERAVHARPDRQ